MQSQCIISPVMNAVAEPTLAPMIVRPTEGPTMQVGPEHVRMILPSAATGGAFHMGEVTIDAPGFGPPYHVHELEDETFMVLDGELIVIVDGMRYDLKPGDVAFAPRNVPHRFESGPNGVRFRIMITGDNFERFFPRYSEAIAAGEMHRLPAIAAEHGITLLVDA